MAAARATLDEVLTPEAYEHAAPLGEKLADGIEAIASAHGVDWRAHGCITARDTRTDHELPSNAIEARASFDIELYELQRLYMANRGIWEAISSAGPACGIHTSSTDVDQYLNVLDAFVGELTG